MGNTNRLIYIPLGGAGEIGMNMYLYGFGPSGKENYIMVDAGVAFPDMASSPGVNLILPDDSFIQKRINRLHGIFISHAHEDHVGAVAHLYGGKDVPIFSRKFTGEIIKQKLSNVGYDSDQLTVVKPFPNKVTLKDFTISFIPIPHSIPESSALLIETAKGNIFHSGDFKMDDNPVIGDSIDYELVEKACNNGTVALMCDSTNVFSKHPGRSESILQNSFNKLFQETNGLIVATTFASNLARLKTIAVSAKHNGRQVCVLGRAMNSMIKAAGDVDVLKGFPSLVNPREARRIPREKLLILATGSQGEARAASAQLSRSSYMNFELGKGDTFIFSSKTIPGNELAVTSIVNRLVERGVNVIYEESEEFHVSGHPNEPDLVKMHGVINPRTIIPIHGEFRHLKAHCTLAKKSGYESIIVPNGTMVEINQSGVKKVEEVEAGRLYLDGNCLINSKEKTILDRLRLAENGICSVSVLIDESGKIFDSAWVQSIGLPKQLDGLQTDLILEESLNSHINLIDESVSSNDEELEAYIKQHLIKLLSKDFGKKPVIQVLISRLE